MFIPVSLVIIIGLNVLLLGVGLACIYLLRRR